MIRSVLAGIALVLVAAGCGSSSAGTTRDHALLASVMSGMKTDLASVELAPGVRSPAFLPNGLTLVIKSDATTTAGKAVDDWYGRIIARAYNAQCEAKADHCLTSFESNMVGRRYVPQPFAGRPNLVAKIRAAFASAGLRVTSITFESPYALAPVITVRTRHPRQAVYAIRKANAAMPCCRVAGSLVEMLDAHGQVFDVETGDLIESTGWMRRGLPMPGIITGPTGQTGPAGH